MITSPHNPRLKLARALHSGRGRRRAGAFLLEGLRLIEDALAADWPLRWALFSRPLNPRGERLLAQLRQAGVPVEEAAPRLLAEAATTATPQPWLAVADLPALAWPERANFVLVPDQVRDPGNLGALLRTAAAFGVQAVCLPPGSSDPFAPKVVRAGMGAHFRLSILRQPWETLLPALRERGLKLVLADMAGEQISWEADLRPPVALIVGGEAEGASAAARQSADLVVRLPMPGGMESLNAAVAGALLLYESLRQSSPNRAPYQRK